MPVRFDQGQIRGLLVHLQMAPVKKGSSIYVGMGKDGIWRTCKFDYHKDGNQVATGTANAIAKALKFGNVDEMKRFCDEKV